MPDETTQAELPQELEALLHRAETLSRENQHADAIALLEKAVEDFPDQALAHYNLGVVWFARLKEDLEHLEVWEDLADEEEDFERAFGALSRSLELDDSLAPALNNLGRLSALRGWHEQAITYFERSLSIDPEQPNVRDDLASVRENL